jgi:hypothetical protein
MDQGNNGMPDWLAQALGIGGGLGQAAGGAFSLWGKQPKNPANTANSYLNQIPGKTEGYYQPYMEAGKGALSDLQNQNKGLLSGETQNQLGANYKESPGYQFKLKQAMQAQGNAAARGGYLGTPMDQQNAAEIGNGLASDDYDKYMQNQMGLYGLGYGGEQGLNTQGFEANKGMADTWGNALSQQGAYGFMGQQGQNQAKQSGMSNLLSGAGTAAASYFGGPAGGMGWSALMNLFNGGGKGA